MHRHDLRIASLFVVLAACPGDPAVETDSGSSSGSSSSTTDDATSKPPTTTTPETTEPTTAPTSAPTSEPTSEPTTVTTVDDTGTSTTTGDTSTGTTAATTGTTADTTTDPVLCGNGALDPGESCDADLLNDETCMSQGFDAGELACAPDCTYDITGCTLFTCGNDGIEGNEVCDGSELGGEDCVTQGFAGGELACAANCGEFDTSGCFVCGNDLIDGGDVCDGADLGGADCVSQGFDDGILACAVDCSGYDVAGCFSCGNNAVEGPEACDGSDLNGETCESKGFFSGDLACQNDCVDFDTAACSNCGNNTVEAPEVCDGDALGSAKCSDQGLEYGFLCCDDSCGGDFSHCLDELLESEPNDDGTPAVGVNDFLAANADGPITASTVVVGAITPAGDDDYYAVTNNANVPAVLSAETWGAMGPGTCAFNDTTQDTRIDVRDANNVVIVTDDDAGIGYCSRVANVVVNPGVTVYVRAYDREDNSVIAKYSMGIDLRPITCGDGFLGTSEQCDDNNLTDGDGCSATCTVDGPNAEVEPNATIAEADANGLVSTGNTRFRGAVAANNDVDRFRLDVAQPGFFRLETFTKTNDCIGTTSNPVPLVRVINSSNATVISDTVGSGIQGCGALVFPLPAGTFYVQVEENGQNAVVPLYQLDTKLLTVAAGESEPNDNLAQADTTLQGGTDVLVLGDHPIGDTDWHAVTVPGCGGSLRLEIIEGDRAVETCESNGIDSQIFLYDSNGKLLDQDDDNGRGFCSAIDGTGSVPLHSGAHNLAPGTYYVQVNQSTAAGSDNAKTFAYRLVATVRTP
ncbi:MAG: pre-peptidase C-terminal domain-containing protein [Myxococcales bacterium]|nr:pre-peptidase C-terminal domain-containing protein [Myxococcales bacterium]